MCNNLEMTVQCLNMFIYFETNFWISSSMAFLQQNPAPSVFCLSSSFFLSCFLSIFTFFISNSIFFDSSSLSLSSDFLSKFPPNISRAESLETLLGFFRLPIYKQQHKGSVCKIVVTYLLSTVLHLPHHLSLP